MHDKTKAASPLTEADESLQRELAMARYELVVARIGIDLHTRALGRIEAALGLTGAPLGEMVNRVLRLRRERDAAVEELQHVSEALRQCDDDCARCAIEGALAHAASVRGGER